MKKKRFLINLWTYLSFAGPSTLIFLGVIIFPFLYGVFLTFTNWDGISSWFSIVGIENYLKAFTDPTFWTSLKLTIKYMILNVIIVNILAFFLAYLLKEGTKSQRFFRAGFFVPNLIGGIILGILWYFIFANVLTYIGRSLNIPLFATSWLGDPQKAFWALVVGAAWQYSGYMMVIYIAGLVSIPRELLEAASIDGAGPLARLRHITIPFMIPSFVVCVFLTIQRSFMVYDINLSLTRGGPYKSTQLISMHVYEKAFTSQQYGVGQAEAFFLFIMVAALTLMQTYFMKKLEVEA